MTSQPPPPRAEIRALGDWSPALDEALAWHARQVAHAAANLCLMAELSASAALIAGLQTLRARAAMVARAQAASAGTAAATNWQGVSDAWRLVTATDLADQQVVITMTAPTPMPTWVETRAITFFAVDQQARALAATGEKKLWLTGTIMDGDLVIAIGAEGRAAALTVRAPL